MSELAPVSTDAELKPVDADPRGRQRSESRILSLRRRGEQDDASFETRRRLREKVINQLCAIDI